MQMKNLTGYYLKNQAKPGLVYCWGMGKGLFIYDLVTPEETGDKQDGYADIMWHDTCNAMRVVRVKLHYSKHYKGYYFISHKIRWYISQFSDYQKFEELDFIKSMQYGYKAYASIMYPERYKQCKEKEEKEHQAFLMNEKKYVF